jgi:hypothetical protein
VAYATATPDATAVANLWTGKANVSYRLGGAGDILAFGVLGGGYPSDTTTGASKTVTGSIGIQFDLSEIANPAQHLLLGGLDPLCLGGGFDSFQFEIDAQGANLYDWTFTDVSAAESFFSAQVLDLGSWSTLGGGGNLLDLSLSFSLTSSQAGSGFYLDFLAAKTPDSVPVPSTLWLFGLGPMAWRVRSRR